MPSKILKIEYDYDFELIGIFSNLIDYKLCWVLNTEMSWKLEKRNDIIIPLAKQKVANNGILQLFETENPSDSQHALYTFEDENNGNNFLIVNNRGSSGTLLPETPNINHFLMVEGWLDDDKLANIIEKINQIPFINRAFKLNFREFANKQNLIFDYDKPKQNENSSYIRTGLLKPRSVRAND